MPRTSELPVCYYPESPPAKLITPFLPTPRETLYLSNLDDQNFLRFSIKYLYLYRAAINLDFLKLSLSRTLVEYYPLAGRLRKSQQNDQKLEVDCNGEGAVFAEAFMDLTADEFNEISQCPNRTFRKLLYQVEAPSFLDIPPLVVQVTKLRCGGMILCTSINHALCDGVGSSQFLHAWAHFTTTPNAQLSIKPFHSRHILRPRNPPRITSTHPTYTRPEFDKPTSQTDPDIFQYLESQPLVSSSITFTSSDILHLKRLCAPSLKCTAFEILASHTWRCWIRSVSRSGFGFGPSTKAKLLFSANIRKILSDLEIPPRFYGNAFILACAEATVKELVEEDSFNLHRGVKLVQQAKSKLTGEFVKSTIDHLEDKSQRVDLYRSLVISSWAKLGLEDLDFGEGRPMQMGSVISYVQCLFLPIPGDADAVRVALSLPESVVNKFEHYMTEFQSCNGVLQNSETKCKHDRDHQVLNETVCSI